MVVTATELRAHRIRVALPTGTEGRIFRRRNASGAIAYPVVHAASFQLPKDVADFGGGAVERMRNSDFFIVLFEYGSESVGTSLFAHQGFPDKLTTSDFSVTTLRKGIPGHCGCQRFFTVHGRPFTLYVVLGSMVRRSALVPRVNAVLAGVSIQSNAISGGPWN